MTIWNSVSGTWVKHSGSAGRLTAVTPQETYTASLLSRLMPAFPLSVCLDFLPLPVGDMVLLYVVLATTMADRRFSSMLREQSPAAQRTAKKAEATADSLIQELTREEDR